MKILNVMYITEFYANKINYTTQIMVYLGSLSISSFMVFYSRSLLPGYFAMKLIEAIVHTV